MLPFASTLSKFITDSQSDGNNGMSGGSLSSSSSYEYISSLTNSGENQVPLLSEREAIKIKAQCLVGGELETKSMTVDPNITSFASLFLLLKKAFNLSHDFDISYLLPKSKGNLERADLFLSLTSDWDLDAAFHTASFPYLEVKVIPVVKGDVTGWDVLESVEAPSVRDIKSNHIYLPLAVSLRHEVSKTLGKVFESFYDTNKNSPLSEKEWINYFDGMGRIMSLQNLKIRVFHGGLEPSVRKEAWIHLLGVFPSDLTIEERTRFLFMKTQVYKHLKENWLSRNPQEIENVTHMVQKDVLRTDRSHPFFNVAEDHPNIVSLFNILTTYALNNTDVSYCQGMSDLAAPLLVVIQDETLTYLCFCKVMARLQNNFLLKGTALLQKFGQLSLLLQRSDEKLYDYFQEIDAGNLYFCYRMLLLELKREFPFAETLRVMEIIWSSIPPEYHDEESEVTFFYGVLQRDKLLNNGRNSPAVESFTKTNCYTTDYNTSRKVKVDPLPHPKYLNDGSPFPLFLCLAVLLNNRDNILLNNMDYSMLAMFFDKMSRKHDANKILDRAKHLFYDYIRAYLDGHTVNPDNIENNGGAMESAHGTKSIVAQC